MRLQHQVLDIIMSLCMVLLYFHSCIILSKTETLQKKKKKNPLKEKQWCFLTEACECKRSFGAKISQPLISIQPHLLLCLVVTWLLMCDWQASASVLIGAVFFSGWLNTWLMDRSGLRVGWACLSRQIMRARIKVSPRVGRTLQKRCTLCSLIWMLRSLARILRFCWDCNSEKDSVDFSHFSVWWPWLAGCSGEHWFLFCQIAGLPLLFACLN